MMQSNSRILRDLTTAAAAPMCENREKKTERKREGERERERERESHFGFRWPF